MIAGLLLTVFIIALFGMTQSHDADGAATYLDQDSPKGILYNKYIDTFQSDSLILIVDGSDPLNPGMYLITWIGWKIPYASNRI